MSFRASPVVGLIAASVLAACGTSTGDDAAGSEERQPLAISAIPDQDPAALTEREEAMASYLADELDIEVDYVPVTDYAASVSLFRAGDLDMVFYGGLTGVQARTQSPDAALLAQRDIDARFRSVFIANAEAAIEPVDEVAGLSVFEGTRFTFGSESSTSGRLMPEYFLRQSGTSGADLDGEPGFSGSHDATVDLVEAGSYEGGVLNAQVWEARKEAGSVDLDKVVEVFVTPTYHDYHWLAGPSLDEEYGDGFTERLREALLGLDGSSVGERDLLDAYGAETVVPTEAGNYERIEEIARELRLLA